MSELLDLAERCEKATGPDRELDKAIMLGIGYTLILPEQPCRLPEIPRWHDPNGVNTHWLESDDRSAPYPRNFTASLDAAMTLVPEGCAPWHCGKHTKTGLHPRTGQRVDGGGDAYLTVGTNEPIYTMAATPALALCAAALRARASQ